MTKQMVNPRLALRAVLFCFAALFLANCAGTPTRTSATYRPAPATSFIVSVRPGDTLSQIAQRYRVSEEDIVAMNYIANPDQIISGDQLYVPAYGLGRAPADALPSYATPSYANPAYANPAYSNPANVAAASAFGQNSASGGQTPPAPYPVSYQERVTTTSPPPSSSPAPNTSARFLWPVSGRVVSGFGAGANGERNDGINIVAARGTPFRAAEAGTVTYVGNELRAFGNLLLIKHDNGFVTAYAHADRIDVVKGQRVEAGQFIGQLGATGDVAEPQLHFEIRDGTHPVNPSALLIESPTNQASLVPSDPASS